MTVRTPWHLWVIGVIAVLWNGMAAVDFTATATQYEPYMESVAQAVKDHIYSLPTWTFAVWGIATWAGLIGSLLLLLRRASAVSLLALSLAGAAGMLLVAFMYPAPGGGIGLAVGIVAVAALLLVYAVAMRRRGVLH
jgi:ABC-type Co2+ transport system permease subunit